MTDPRPSFATLEDASGVGQALAKVLEGDAAVGKNASPSLVAKDPSGNLIYLKAAADGSLVFSQEVSAYLRQAASGAGASGFSTVTTITLSASKAYRGLDLTVACARDAVFDVIWNDNGTEKIIDSIIVGSGQASHSYSKVHHSFTSGTGTQQLLVKAKNLTSILSDFRAAAAVREIQ